MGGSGGGNGSLSKWCFAPCLVTHWFGPPHALFCRPLACGVYPHQVLGTAKRRAAGWQDVHAADAPPVRLLEAVSCAAAVFAILLLFPATDVCSSGLPLLLLLLLAPCSCPCTFRYPRYTTCCSTPFPQTITAPPPSSPFGLCGVWNAQVRAHSGSEGAAARAHGTSVHRQAQKPAADVHLAQPSAWSALPLPLPHLFLLFFTLFTRCSHAPPNRPRITIQPLQTPAEFFS